ncbi:hypothetical protein THIOM_000139 [Candidatus Thiomargarita nelsonii]|uniref:Uncharacterized protein n=1 Tax=Candidatus Thiomargarita nelsonii TaxID=1003181 RepID=A0A176S7G3_9GAMM|nr:hypothetical protein THIOM_000139 [Candidatus Thiomargarita nelsonii]
MRTDVLPILVFQPFIPRRCSIRSVSIWSKAILASSGEIVPPCGVPISVWCSSLS